MPSTSDLAAAAGQAAAAAYERAIKGGMSAAAAAAGAAAAAAAYAGTPIGPMQGLAPPPTTSDDAAPSREYVCHGRTMRNLTADQSRLAHFGRISARLRSASPVHYWQHTTQRRARYEAVCTRGAARWHLMTFGSHGKYEEAAKTKCLRVNRLTRHRIDSCTPLSFAKLPPEWAARHGVRLGTRGIGYWRWKAFLILERLRAIGDGDVLVYADYDLLIAPTPHDDLSALFCLGANAVQGVAPFHFPCFTDRAWTKREAAIALNATDAMLDSAQLFAGLLVLRRTPTALAFVEEWLGWSLHSPSGDHAGDHAGGGGGGVALISDALDASRQHASFRAHRHDQSLLSLLAKRRGVKSFPLPTKLHDVRDIWAWEAGYCADAFTWPLPSYRTPGVYGYITHYKEMGHQHAAMRQCLKQQGGSAPLPLADYVDSRHVLRHIRADEQMAAAHKRRKFSPAELVASEAQCDISLLHQLEHLARQAPCVANVSFGAIRHRGRCHAWTAGSCQAGFRCAGTVMQCGSVQIGGKVTFCGCSPHSDGSLDEMRHWFDGQDPGRFEIFAGKKKDR